MQSMSAVVTTSKPEGTAIHTLSIARIAIATLLLLVGFAAPTMRSITERTWLPALLSGMALAYATVIASRDVRATSGMPSPWYVTR